MPRNDEYFSSKSNYTKRIAYHIYQGDTGDERSHHHFLEGNKGYIKYVCGWLRKKGINALGKSSYHFDKPL